MTRALKVVMSSQETARNLSVILLVTRISRVPLRVYEVLCFAQDDGTEYERRI